jgi:hypothetical protein
VALKLVGTGGIGNGRQGKNKKEVNANSGTVLVPL